LSGARYRYAHGPADANATQTALASLKSRIALSFCYWLIQVVQEKKLLHIHTTVYSSLDFVRDNPGELVPEETFTHSHLSRSSIIPYLLHLSNTIRGILPVQSMCLTVFFHNLCPSFLWSTSWPGTLHFTLHTFLRPIIVFFSQHMPIPSQPVPL